MGTLTKTFVAQHREPGTYGDGDNLYLQVREGKGGLRKSWIFRYQLPGRSVRYKGLGSAKDVSLASAREAARLCRLQVAKGIDPIDSEAAERVKVRLASVTFQEAAERYIAFMEPKWSPSTLDGHRRAMRKHVYPKFGAAPVSSVNVEHIKGFMAPLWEGGREVIAKQVLNLVKCVLDYAGHNGWRDEGLANPAEWRTVKYKLGTHGTHVKRNNPTLEWQRIGEFMAALRAIAKVPQLSTVGVRPITCAMLEFQILTAARPTEAREARWEEIDFENKVWRKPAGRVKGRKAHLVPLSEAAIRLLKAQDSKGFIFQARWSNTSHNAPISQCALVRLLGELGHKDAHGAGITAHGFRSTFSCWGADQDWPSDLVEASLDHQFKSEVRGTYDTTDALERRRPLMEAWGQMCDGEPAKVGNVTPLRRKA